MIVAPEVGSAGVVEMDVTVGMCSASCGSAGVPGCGAAREAVIALCVSNSATRVATNSVGLGPAAEEVAGAEQAERRRHTAQPAAMHQWENRIEH